MRPKAQDTLSGDQILSVSQLCGPLAQSRCPQVGIG
jgi:hypothetical protein